MADALKLRKGIVRALYRRIQIRLIVATNQYRECFGALRAGQRNHGALFYLWLVIERGLEICGKDLETRSGNDRVLTPPAKKDVPRCINFANVAGVYPALLIGERLSGAIPVTGRHVFAAYENLAVVTQLHFLTRNRFADRASLHAKRMRQAGERRSFSHAIALNHCVTQPPPKSFRVAFQSCTAGDESPEAPTKTMMHASKRPPVAQEMPSLSGLQLFFYCAFA